MTDQLLDRVQIKTRDYPLASRASEEMLTISPTLLRSQLEHLLHHQGERFWPRAERLVGLSMGLGGNPAHAIVDYTMAYLREQVAYMQTKEYSHTDFDEVRREVYDNAEVMEGFYLDGLMLSHAFWPIHFEMHDFFEQEFLSRLPAEGVGAEYGFGHGLYLLETLKHAPNTRAMGFDISPYSRQYAARLLQMEGIQPDRYQLGFADVREPLEAADNSYSWCVFAEIIEHIPDPLASLSELCRTMKPGAPLFATTVVFSNAIDHLYQFPSTEAVSEMIEEAGFEVLAEKVLRVADYGDKKSRDPSIDVAIVCTPRK